MPQIRYGSHSVLEAGGNFSLFMQPGFEVTGRMREEVLEI